MHKTLILLLVTSLALTGCWWNRNRRDPNFGHSVRQAMQAQIIKPSTGDTTPVTGMNADSAVKSIDGYHNSYGASEDIDIQKLIVDESGS